MPDGSDESRLAWLLEPQQRDVALQQSLVVATAARESRERTATPTSDGDTGQQATVSPATDGSAHVATPAPADPTETLAEQLALAVPDAPPEAALQRRRAPLSVRLVTVVRGTGAPLGRLGAPRRTRPMSFAAQFVIAMVATMTLVTTLALASPIATGSPFRGTFTSMAGAVPWIPTPTPRPTPVPPRPPASGYGHLPAGPLPPPPLQPNPGSAVVQDYIRQVFGPWAGQALGVARCESGYNPNAWNPYELLRSHAAGVFQMLYPSTWAETPYWSSNPFDYRLNILGAYWLFSRDGHTWREWACGTILGYN